MIPSPGRLSVNGSILLSVLVIMLVISDAARDQLAGGADALT